MAARHLAAMVELRYILAVASADLNLNREVLSSLTEKRDLAM